MQQKSKKRALIALLTVLVTVAGILTVTGFDNPGSSDLNGMTPDVNQSYRIPDTVTFAGERMPLENFDTRESLERELIITAYRHSATILIIKRASRYFPVIEPILKEYNIPDCCRERS
jgi:hypothetical protein